MKRLYLLACSALWFSNRTAFAQENTVPESCEYWLDTYFDQRVNVPITGKWSAELDVAELSPGLHSIGFRISDSKGRWSSPMAKYFLRISAEESPSALSTYTYWIDTRYSEAKTVPFANGSINLDLDLSALSKGIHTFSYQARNDKGQWSTPVAKHFLRTSVTETPANLTYCTYWIDNDHSEAKTVPFANGTVNLDLYINTLSKGIHTFSYQASDDNGRLSIPTSHYFLIPDLPVYGKNITAYEYWFNHGPRVRVEVDPDNPFSLQDTWIDIKDVVPNNISDDYRFDVANETVYCEDDVFFGMQVYDDAGKGSQAILSDTFHITVAVVPDFITLKDNVEASFTAPTVGNMQGLKIETHTGDSLYWNITPGSAVDFYTAEGERLESNREETEEGKICYSMKASTEQTYALVYHASYVVENMETTCSVITPSGIGNTTSAFRYHTEKNKLWIESDAKTPVCITDLSGRMQVEQTIDAGTNRIDLLPGIYIVRFDNHETVKVLIP